ncbi:hypothetical protein CJJ18_11625 (plasmid) [Candidatus Williamhamiltonella defendens]|uniref:Pilus assembly protein n=1 Tax=Candidatus Williamhamiltonella defendens TaxID=138072 RepID=A0AAC9VNX1_9ENTR|nr:type 4b pilus protein PilO2 [Candidatus Hamiltonella defensa]ASV34609.1 hypothetical protein CJJ18_11625 [Candidatus Hamiltonella defensa]
MTTIPGLTATSIVRGRRVFLAGIDWLPLPLRAGKNVKSAARRQGADRVVSYRYRDRQKNPQWVMGLVNWSALALPKGCKDGYALALLIVPQLKGSGYAIIEIDKTHYGFVSSIEGVLINDVVGGKAAIAQAQKNFLQFNLEPEGGWQIFAPAEWNIADSLPFDLDDLLAGTAFPARARFQATSRQRRWLGLFTLSGLILAGYVGWQGVQTHQETLRQAAIRAAWLAQKQAQTSPVLRAPWHDSPRLMPFINACAERWQKIPLSMAGWRFKEAQCAQEGTLRLAYSKPAGATVGDFADRVKQVYAGQTTPYFNLPGQGDTGGLSQPVTFTASKDTRALPEVDYQIQRLTTFAQRRRLPIHLQEDDPRQVSAQGEERILPWRSFSFSLETALPPTCCLMNWTIWGYACTSSRSSSVRGA